MNIKIINGVVNHSGKEFAAGDEIKQMKKEEGQRLVRLGMAEEIVKEKANTSTGDDSGNETGGTGDDDNGSGEGSEGEGNTP